MSTPNVTPNIEDVLFTDVDFLTSDPNVTPTTAEPGNTPSTVTTDGTTVTPAPTQDEFFLKMPTGTVYKTKEEAERGFAEKDLALEKLRKFAIEQTGFDPLTNRQVAQVPVKTPQATTTPTPEDNSYVKNPKKYVEDLSKAWESNDPAQYAQVQNRLIQENLQAILGPVAPIIQQNVQRSAMEQVSKTVKDFNQSFFESTEFKSVMDENPTLASAIKNAETYIEYKDQLPELYRIAYALTANKKVPEIVRQAQTTPTQPPTQARPTASPSTMNPPAQVPSNNWKTDPAARKAFLESMKSKGMDNLSLSLTRPPNS